jgi:hypothetical protein
MELKLISTTPVPGGENRRYECGGRWISVSRIHNRFEVFVIGTQVIQMTSDKGQLDWERVARAGLAYCE